MSWTYDITLPTTRDQVRLRIGDTISTDQQMQNEELDALLAATGDNVNSASLAAARMLQARYARQVDKWVGDLKILASQRARAYASLIEEIESVVSVGRGTPFAGGIRVDAKSTLSEDSSLVQPSFRRGMFDNTEE